MCFTKQDYPGSKQLVVLNDAVEQKLRTCASPEVKIVNAGRRFASLADKRNSAVSAASYAYFMMVDDDDLFMPWHLSECVKSLLLWGRRPIWPTSYYHADGLGTEFKSRLVKGSIPSTYLMAQNQFWRLGGYASHLSVGEDQDLRNRAYVAHGCQEEKNPAPPRPGFVYRWNNGVYHLSGSSEHRTALDRAQVELHSRFASGEEPTGDVYIEAAWDLDYASVLPTSPS